MESIKYLMAYKGSQFVAVLVIINLQMVQLHHQACFFLNLF